MKYLLIILLLTGCSSEHYYLVSTSCAKECVIMIEETKDSRRLWRDSLDDRGFANYPCTDRYFYIQKKKQLMILFDTTEWHDKLKNWFPKIK